MILREAKLAQLAVGDRVVWIGLENGLEVGLGLLVLLLVGFGGSAPEVGVDVFGMGLEGVLGDLRKEAGISALVGNSGQACLGFKVRGVDAGGFSKGRLGGGKVALGGGHLGEEKLELDVVGRVLGGFLGQGKGIVDFAGLKQKKRVEDLDRGQVGVGLAELIDDLACRIVLILLHEDAGVLDLNGHALGELGGELGKDGLGMVELVGADIEVAEQFRSLGVVAEVVDGLTEGGFGLGLVSRAHVEAGEGGAGLEILGRVLDGG